MKPKQNKIEISTHTNAPARGPKKKPQKSERERYVERLREEKGEIQTQKQCSAKSILLWICIYGLENGIVGVFIVNLLQIGFAGVSFYFLLLRWLAIFNRLSAFIGKFLE